MSVELRNLVRAFAGLKIVVIGDAMLDSYLTGSGRRLCQEAPVPVVDGCVRDDLPGGAANVAVNLTALGADCRLLGVVGADLEGERLRSLLAAARVDTEGLLVSGARDTLAKQRVLCGTQMLVRFDLGTSEALDDSLEQDLLARLEDELLRADALIVSDYGYGTVTPALINRLGEIRSRFGGVIAVDSKSLEQFRGVGVTLAKPNYSEAARLVHLPPDARRSRTSLVMERSQDLLDATNAEFVAVTLDREGAVLMTRGGQAHCIPARPAPEVQTSGAGDTFLAALTLGLAAGGSAEAAAQVAGAAASVVVGQARTRTCGASRLFEGLGFPPSDCDFHQLLEALQPLRAAGQTIALTNGCFDILHRGHVNCLRQAKRLADVLVVGVNTDATIRRLKGPGRPINCLDDRLGVLAGLGDVDYVVPFSEETPHRLIEAVRPDVFIKGGDYTRETLPEADLVERLGGRIVIFPYMTNRSTTRIIERIRTSGIDDSVSQSDESPNDDSLAVERRREHPLRQA